MRRPDRKAAPEELAALERAEHMFYSHAIQIVVPALYPRKG